MINCHRTWMTNQMRETRSKSPCETELKPTRKVELTHLKSRITELDTCLCYGSDGLASSGRTGEEIDAVVGQGLEFEFRLMTEPVALSASDNAKDCVANEFT